MTRVAIHQPNYLPWLGFFYKASQADVLVLLDDAQFPKHSYTNRVRIGAPSGPRWLTVPVTVKLGMKICQATAAQPDWRKRHFDTLRQVYRKAAHYAQCIEFLEEVLLHNDEQDLASINQTLIARLFELLSISTRIMVASALVGTEHAGDERLIRLVHAVDSTGHYLSGKGGQNYQDESKFIQFGLGFEYVKFEHPDYLRGSEAPVVGLSIVDALFHVGIAQTSAWMRRT